MEDSDRKRRVRESPDIKKNDETLVEVKNIHVPHGEENISVVKGPTHSKLGVLRKALFLMLQ